MTKIEKTILLAVVLSVSVHVAFFAVSPHIVLSGMKRFMNDTRKIFRIKEVDKKAEKVSLFSGKKNPVATVKMSKRAITADYKFMKQMKIEALSKEDMSYKKKRDQLDREKIKEKKLSKLNQEDILKTEEAAARKDAEPEKRSLLDKLSSESKVSTGDEPVKYEGRSSVEIENSYSDISDMDSFSSKAGVTDPGNLLTESYRNDNSQYEDIGTYIDILLSKYIDPTSGEKFFRLLIKVKDGIRLEVMPKEIIFLIDSSKSITEKKLNFLKSGLKKVLTKFNEGDKFNLIAFRGDLIKFRKNSVQYSNKLEEEAIRFIDDLDAVGQTDVEKALYGIVAEPINVYPSYLMLMSDGRPTMGIMDSRRIIQEITKENNKKRPIFSFTGGSRINKFLLEFISYQNRAWSYFSSTTFDMENDFIDFYEQIKDPILVDVRYFFLGANRDEVYPKYLSDFYHGKPLEIYGKYGDEKDFSMQILGRALDNTSEIIFQKSFDEAEDGGKEIARNWAFRKIYFLISQNTMGLGNPLRLKKEIEELSERFDILTPYAIKNGE